MKRWRESLISGGRAPGETASAKGLRQEHFRGFPETAWRPVWRERVSRQERRRRRDQRGSRGDVWVTQEPLEVFDSGVT